jgi:2-alkenal reductase
LDRAGHIVTNHHVIARAEQIGVLFSDERAHPARLVGTTAWVDLVFNGLEQRPNDLPPIPIGGSADLVQFVYAIGNPFGPSHSLTMASSARSTAAGRPRSAGRSLARLGPMWPSIPATPVARSSTDPVA